MNAMRVRVSVARLAAAAGFWLLAGCESGDDGLENQHPGANDLNVVVAFGDSITQGGECACAPYPARLAGMIGKVVYNAGIGGSQAIENVGRTQSVIDRYHPAYLFILYGVNDLIASAEAASVLDALGQMLDICEANQVVPVLATYPQPIGNHLGFAERTLLLNEGIRQLAQARGIFCVDLEREFAADPALYEGDGLHPNEAGTVILTLAFADLF